VASLISTGSDVFLRTFGTCGVNSLPHAHALVPDGGSSVEGKVLLLLLLDTTAFLVLFRKWERPED
jgi:hypothetical protein